MNDRPDSNDERRRAETTRTRRILPLFYSASKNARFSRRRRTLVGVLLTAASTLTAFVGCASLNDNPNNTRCWFPTLRAPSKEEQAARAKTFPEGGDPYGYQSGPRSLATSPNRWSSPRERTSTTLGVLPDVEYDDDKD